MAFYTLSAIPVAAFSTLLLAVAQANPPVVSAAGSDLHEFYTLDRNGDGVLENKETAANPEVLNNFSRLDQNTDGTLTEAEFSRMELDGQKALPSEGQSAR